MASNKIIVSRIRRGYLRRIWDQFRVSFWFMPLVMAIFAILLSNIFFFIDTLIPDEVLENSQFILSGSAVEMRSTLASLATTTLATAGVVFSLLTLPLSTVASQYGSRLLRIYLSDRTTQIVLGMFTGTFTYCMVTVLKIPRSDQINDLPQLTATFALVLFLATFASLIALIHHISTALQAPNIVAAAGAELCTTVRELSQERVNNHPEVISSDQDTTEKSADGQGDEIYAKTKGYIQSIDLERMLHLAIHANLIINLVKKPGRFIAAGDPIAVVQPADHVNQHVAVDIRHAFLIGRQRTPTQDLEYAVNQLAEVALRAMSPAINDPFTAMTCIDHLGVGLALYAEQDRPQPNIYDSEGHLRLIYEPVSFDELLSAAFDMLRHASKDNAAVLLKMLDAFETIGRKTQDADRLRELQRQVKLVQAESEAANLISADRLIIRQRCEALAQIL